MADAAVRSKVMMLLLLIHCLLLVQLFWGIVFWFWFCDIVLGHPFHLAVFALRKRELVGWFTLIISLLSFVCLYLSAF